MTRVYITGMTGTVAPYLRENLIQKGYEVVDTHIRINGLRDIQTSLDEIKKANVSMIFHLALGPIEWTKALVTYAVEHHIQFVYISTVSVFEDNAGGPYHIQDEVHVTNEYGLYKYTSEQLVQSIDSHAYIIRIGWQIDPHGNTQSNNMMKFFQDQINQNGVIQASQTYYPSCSMLDDTVEAMTQIVFNQPPGLYLVNANTQYSLYEIAAQLIEKWQLNWTLTTSDFTRNDLMIDARVVVPFQLK
jgi:dTDP-4-dehydrorhamnose reductase